MDAGIIIHAEEVELVLDRDLYFHGPGKREFDDENTGPERVDDRVIVKVVRRLLQEPVEGVPFFPGSEHGHIMRHTDLRIRDISMDDVVGLAVAGEDVLQGNEGTGNVSKTRRHASVKVPADQDDIRFIERYPVTHVPERRDHLLGIAQEFLDRLRAMPGKTLEKPAGMREMVERDHRLDVVAAQDIDDFLIMGDGLFIPGVRARLNPAPFDGKSIGIYTQLLQELQVLPKNGVVIRDLRNIA